MGDKIIVTLKRSPIGRPKTQRETLKGLGLTKLNKTVIHKNIPSIRGMIKKVIHLVEIKEVDNEA